MLNRTKAWLEKRSRKATLALVRKANADTLLRKGRERMLTAWRASADAIPAYRDILAEHGIDPSSVGDLDTYCERVPFLDKLKVFEGRDTADWCLPGALDRIGGVVTSSGQSGHFAFGLSSHREMHGMRRMVDLALQQTCDTDNRKTLLINALPMGVGFTSNTATVAETSVREDMVLALIQRFGNHYQQLILVTDPLFLKRLLDFAAEKHYPLGSHRIHVAIGEETFSEGFRDYVHRKIGLDPSQPDPAFVGGSFGIAELGLHLFFELPETVGLKRWAMRHRQASTTLFGDLPENDTAPMLYAFNPLRTWVEVIDPDPDGYGRIAISSCEKREMYPLFRYLSGDIGRLIAPADTLGVLSEQAGSPVANYPFPLIAIRGRDSERLPNGLELMAFKDAIYRDHEIADQLSGAFKLQFADEDAPGYRIDIQLRRGASAAPDLRNKLLGVLPCPPKDLNLVEYPAFEYGMTLDYERKFNYYR